MNNEQIENEIQEKNLTAPRITPADLDSAVRDVEYAVFAGSTLTVCVITMQNGFTVTGESACASPENFDKELGEKIAYDRAYTKMWPLLGYALREKLNATS